MSALAMRLEGADYQWRKIHPENCRLIQKLTNDLAGRKSRVDLFCLKPTVHGPVLALSTDRDTPLHVGNWVMNGPMTVIAKMTFMTHFADPEADFAVLHNLPNCDIGRPLNSPLCPGHDRAERWLDVHGSDLHRYGLAQPGS